MLSTHDVACRLHSLHAPGKWGKIYVLRLAAELIKDLFPAHLTRPARLEMLDALRPLFFSQMLRERAAIRRGLHLC